MCVSILAGSGGGDFIYDSPSGELKGSDSHFEEVKLEANPAYVEVAKPASTTEPQYEECGGGVTNSGDVVMEENPAYQCVAVVHSDKIEEPAYQNVTAL